MRRFSDAYHISYPLLADKGSEVIRKFGILNTNVPTDVRFYGIPFPGQYLLAPDGTVRSKDFMSDYQERPTGSSVLLTEFGSPAAGKGVEVSAEDVKATVMISNPRAFSGNGLGVLVKFDVAPGWHIYGQPLPEGYTPTAVTFDKDLVATQQFTFPKPTPVKFELLGETLPVYQGTFEAAGHIVLKQKLPPGEHRLSGTVDFQECNDSMCKMPQSAHFEIPITIEPLTPAAPKA